MKTCITSVTLFCLFVFISAQLNCPINQIKFEKIIGLKPRSNEKRNLLYKSQNIPITQECIKFCKRDMTCASFLLDYQKSECYSYPNIITIIEYYDYSSTDGTDIVWFRKTCDPHSDCQKLWNFETIAGANFVGYDTKYIGNVTRQQCVENCKEEKSFLCRSIKFFAYQPTDLNSLVSCTLSEMDRHLIPQSFRVSRYENEYLENQCINTSLSEFCTYEEYSNSVLKHSDVLIKTSDEDQCRVNCDKTTAFNCRGYSILKKNKEINCYLHSEDIKLVGPKLLIPNQDGTYFEKARCLNVSVQCSDKYMVIRYVPEQIFTGRVYTSDYSDVQPCYAEGNYSSPVILTIPVENGMCGLSEINSSATPKRYVKSVLIVIQYNPLIQMQGDRYVRVGCESLDGNDSITLGTNINLTNSQPNKGATVISNSSILPAVNIKVVDYATKLPTMNTQIGQELQMIIEIKPANGPYDMWVSNLEARSESGQESIELIDEKGCVTQPQVFGPFTKLTANNSLMLVSTFQAFKFTSSTVVRFSVIVHFCIVQCPERNCKPRRRRDSSVGTNATVVFNNNTNFREYMPLNILLIVKGLPGESDQPLIGKDTKILISGIDWTSNEMCIDFALFVGLCVCWVTLQIIFFICWFLLIRKYKKKFNIAYTRHHDEQLSDTHTGFDLGGDTLNRRVHWADQ